MVEAVYFTDDYGKSKTADEPTTFSFEEESAMQLWKNVLNSDHTVQMIDISYDMLTRTEVLTEENSKRQKSK